MSGQPNGLVTGVSFAMAADDNALPESFFTTIKKELIYEHIWSNHEEFRVFYNQQRLHSYLDYMSPTYYEDKYEQMSKNVA